MAETLDHLQEDIVIRPQTLVTCYRHGQAFCARCHQPVVQTGEGELLNAHSVLPSLVQTARRQGVLPLAFLQTLLTANTAKAQAALFYNSS